MAAVLAILTILMTVVVGMVNDSGFRSRKAAVDLLAGMIEQARTTAIHSRCPVALAIAEPGDFSGRERECRLGLFKLAGRPEASMNQQVAVMVGRWRSLGAGLVLSDGRVGGLENPLDAPEITISCDTNKPHVMIVHALVFNSRGGLQYPVGSSPVIMRIAEGAYHGGTATPFVKGKAGGISESRLRIGRVTARPYRLDE